MSSLSIGSDIDDGALTEQLLANSARVRLVLEKVADKWTVMILIVICPKPSRFNEIKRRLHGITHKALSDALKRLERNGLVTRTVLPTTPIGVEYAITPLGQSLREPFEALYAWALSYGPAVEEACANYDHGKSIDGHPDRAIWKRNDRNAR